MRYEIRCGDYETTIYARRPKEAAQKAINQHYTDDCHESLSLLMSVLAEYAPPNETVFLPVAPLLTELARLIPESEYAYNLAEEGFITD